MYSFDQLQDAVRSCTSYDLIQRFSDADDIDEYVMIDPFGDQDGDPFYDLDDVIYYVTGNDQVNKYLQGSY
jgi:hypothetical protein